MAGLFSGGNIDYLWKMNFIIRPLYFFLTVIFCLVFLKEASSQTFITSSVNIEAASSPKACVLSCDSTHAAFVNCDGAAMVKGGKLVYSTAASVSNGKAVKKLVKLTSAEFPKGISVYRFLFLEKKLYGFAYSWNNEYSTVFCGELDPQTLKQVSDAQIVFQDESKSLPDIITSEDQKLVMIANADVTSRLHAVILQGDLVKNREIKASLEKDYGYLFLAEMHLTNEGVIFFTASNSLPYRFEDADNPKAEKLEWHIFTCYPDSKKVTDHTINLDSAIVLSVRASVLPNGNLICSGLYGNGDNLLDSKDRVARGVFYFSFPHGSEVPVLKKVAHFPEDFIIEAQSEPGILNSRSSSGLLNLYLDKIITNADGFCWLVTEHCYGPGRNYGEINVIGIRGTGELAWCERIFKKQEFKDGDEEIAQDYYSFSSFGGDGEIFIFYNEDYGNSPNENVEGNATYRGEKQGTLVCATVRINGTIEKRPVFSFNKDTNTPIPTLMSKNGNTFWCFSGARNLNQTNGLIRIIYQ